MVGKHYTETVKHIQHNRVQALGVDSGQELAYINKLRFTTDPPTNRDMDRVFPIFDDESIFIANRLMVNKGDKVLDLGTGSGIFALFAAQQKAAEVIATDINSKAVNYARENARINGLAGRIEFHQGNLFEPVEGRKFNLIICNPPFVPTPPNARFF